MLRRFNSLIKGPKALSDEESTEQVSLRPARSVDSSLFASPQQVAPASPLNPLLVRRSEDGQTSLNVHVPNGSSREQLEAERGPRAFVIGRVPEERSWKEGYEQANLDSPGTPQEQYEPGEKPSDFHSVDLHGSYGGATDTQESTPPVVGQSADEGAQPQFEFIPVPAQRQIEIPRVSRTSSDAVVAMADTVVDIPDTQAGCGVDLEDLRKSVATTGPGRTISSWSTDSAAEHCRICQQHSEEPLIDLGCLCRGEMAKTHKSCIEMWFQNKGTNKCEVCQHVASNIPAPATSPMPHFWVWRLGGPTGAAQALASQAGARRARFHPLWAALGILFAGLLFDVLISIFLGASALPVNIIIGVLVVLGLGTAVRLVMECCHERAMERSIRQMELLSIDPEPVQAGADEPTVQNRPALPV